MDDLHKKVDALNERVDSLEGKLDSILELVQMGKGIMWLAKIGAGCLGFAATCMEVWRYFFTKP
jgi:hypothetical protein